MWSSSFTETTVVDAIDDTVLSLFFSVAKFLSATVRVSLWLLSFEGGVGGNEGVIW